MELLEKYAKDSDSENDSTFVEEVEEEESEFSDAEEETSDENDEVSYKIILSKTKLYTVQF